MLEVAAFTLLFLILNSLDCYSIPIKIQSLPLPSIIPSKQPFFEKGRLFVHIVRSVTPTA